MQPAASAEAAVRGHKVVAAASSARGNEPVLHGEWLAGCRLLCAVGNTRKQFAEVDVQCFRDAALTVADSPHAQHEAGDLIQALEAGALAGGEARHAGGHRHRQARNAADGLIAFKSVGYGAAGRGAGRRATTNCWARAPDLPCGESDSWPRDGIQAVLKVA